MDFPISISVNMAISLEEVLEQKGYTPQGDVGPAGLTYRSLAESVGGIYDQLDFGNKPPKRFLTMLGNDSSGNSVFIKACNNEEPNTLNQFRLETTAALKICTNGHTFVPKLLDIDLEKKVVFYQAISQERHVLKVPTIFSDISQSELEKRNDILRTRFLLALENWTSITREIPDIDLTENANYSPQGYISRLSTLATKNIYTISSEGRDEKMDKLPLGTSQLNFITQLIEKLDKKIQSPVLLHLDFAPQNILGFEDAQFDPNVPDIIVDLENVCLSHYEISKYADIAFLISRLWFNPPLQEGLIQEFTFRMDKNNQILFHINLITECWTRISRPLGFYATGQEDGHNIYAQDMVPKLQTRMQRNLHLIQKSYTLLEQFVQVEN